MPTKPVRELVVPPKQPGAEWFTLAVPVDDHPTQDENRERRRLGLALRAFLPAERIAAIIKGPKYQIPPTHLPADQMAVYGDCVRLLNEAIALSRAEEGPGSMYSGRRSARAWAVFHVEDLAVQQVRWVEEDCCPLGVNPMAVLLEAEAQLQDVVDNAGAPDGTPVERYRSEWMVAALRGAGRLTPQSQLVRIPIFPTFPSVPEAKP